MASAISVINVVVVNWKTITPSLPLEPVINCATQSGYWSIACELLTKLKVRKHMSCNRLG